MLISASAKVHAKKIIVFATENKQIWALDFNQMESKHLLNVDFQIEDLKCFSEIPD